RPPLAATLRRRLRRIGQMRAQPRPLDLLNDEPPARRRLKREMRIDTRKLRQPLPHRPPRRRNDPAPPHLAAAQVKRLRRDLPPLNIKSTYDLHRHLLQLHRLKRPRVSTTRLSRGGPTTCHLPSRITRLHALWLRRAKPGCAE